MVYFAKKDGQVIHHTDLEAMMRWSRAVPEKTLSDGEFESCGFLARIIDGKIFFGKTPKEKADDEAALRIDQIDAELKEIDAKTGGRSVRTAILSLKGTLPESAAADVAKIEDAENRAKELRAKRSIFAESLSIPY